MKPVKAFLLHYRAIVMGLAISFLALLLQFSQIDIINTVMERAEGIIYDMRLRATLQDRSEGFADILVVDLDEHTMEQIGWPWPRQLLGQLINNLADAGTAVVAFDVIFPEPERNPAVEVMAELQNRGIDASEVQALVNDMDGDLAFMQSFDSMDVLFGYLLEDDKNVRRGILPTHEIMSEHPINDDLEVTEYEGYVTSLPKFHEASAGEGFFNSAPESDGFLRKSALVYRFENKLFPSLSLEAARLYALADAIEVKTQVAGNKVNVEGIVIGNELIRTDAEGKLLIPYRGGERSFEYVSAYKVLNNDFDAEKFEGAIVFVGTSSVSLADLRATPVGVQYPGVEVHANVLEGILKPEILKYRPDWWQGAVFVYLTVLGVFMSFTMPYLSPGKMALVSVLALGGTIGGNVYFWSELNISLPMASSIILVLSVMAYNISVGFFSENKKREQIKGIFNQYVPPAHIDKMLEEPENVSMDGERKELTVLFSDIRDFTTISENLTANELKELLNRYFDPITETIFTHQGTIDKYVGDMVMAFWGAPLDDEKHAEHAVLTAFEMLRITERLREEFIKDGLPAIHVGIGLNTGEMNVGDMGSTFRRAYTVLGDAVNLGSRLEGLTKFYGLECLVSEFTKEQCPNIKFRAIDKVKVKGKNTAVAIFEPLDPNKTSSATLSQLDTYHQAYDHYLQQNWDGAQALLEYLLEKEPDETLYSIYLERISHLRSEPLPEDWDGSFTHTTK